MGLGSGWHWLLILLVFVLLFSAGKISGLMGDLAKGIKSFKKEMAEGDEKPEAVEPEAKIIEHKVEKRQEPPKSASKAPRSRKSG